MLYLLSYNSEVTTHALGVLSSYNKKLLLWQAAEPVTWTSQAVHDFAMSEDSLNLVLL